MTLSNTTTKVTYTGDGSNRRFDIPFPYTDDSELSIIVTDEDGAETAVVAAYEVDSSKTFLTYPTTASQLDPLPSTHKLTIVRSTPLTQENDLMQQATLDKESLEDSLDKLTRITQELAEQNSRALKTKVSGTTTTPDEYVETIQQAVATATEKATTATLAASQASTNAVSAYNSAGTAATKASLASGYADAAAGSASNALTYKEAAESSATSAANAKTAAEAAQTAAESAKASAKDYKDAAAASATAAGTSEATALSYKNAAVSASEAATAAKETAVEAKGDAQTAATSAQAAAAQLSAHNTSDTAHADMRLLIAGKQDALVAGDNIQINGNVISATGGGGGGGSANWGSIGGTLSNQTDLSTELGKLQPKTLATPITVDGTEKTTVEAALGAINTLAAGKAASSHTHTKSQITDFPTVPTKLSDLTDDLGSSPTHTHSQYLESVDDASTSAKGIIQIASAAEVAAGTNTSKAVVPYDLAQTLAGYQAALPSGTTGHYLKKTANGVEWAAVSAGGLTRFVVSYSLSTTVTSSNTGYYHTKVRMNISAAGTYLNIPDFKAYRVVLCDSNESVFCYSAGSFISISNISGNFADVYVYMPYAEVQANEQLFTSSSVTVQIKIDLYY